MLLSTVEDKTGKVYDQYKNKGIETTRERPKRAAMPNPLVIPTTNPSIRKLSVPVAPTAASALSVIPLPTIMISARLYSCWKRIPHYKGKKNNMICFILFPEVIFCVVCSVFVMAALFGLSLVVSMPLFLY